MPKYYSVVCTLSPICKNNEGPCSGLFFGRGGKISRVSISYMYIQYDIVGHFGCAAVLSVVLTTCSNIMVKVDTNWAYYEIQKCTQNVLTWNRSHVCPTYVLLAHGADIDHCQRPIMSYRGWGG